MDIKLCTFIRAPVNLSIVHVCQMIKMLWKMHRAFDPYLYFA